MGRVSPSDQMEVLMQDTIRHSLDPVHPVAVEVQRRALRTVARHARDAADLALLAEALDLPLNAGGGSAVPGVCAAYAELAGAVLAGDGVGQGRVGEVGVA